MGVKQHTGLLAVLVTGMALWGSWAVAADSRGGDPAMDDATHPTSVRSSLYQPLEAPPEGGLPRSPVPPRLYKLYRAMPNPVPDGPESVAKGELVYGANCQVCHGGVADGSVSGRGFTPGPVDLTERRFQAARSDGELFYAIRNGVDGTAMLPWGSRLSDRDIWMVVRYLRSVAGR